MWANAARASRRRVAADNVPSADARSSSRIASYSEGSVSTPTCAWFFAGLALAAAGSAYYHLAPDDGRLVWDRLPMTITFAGAFASVGAAKYPRAWSTRLLGLMLLSGPMSVVWWAVSGNLAWYVAVQFGGLLWLAVSLFALRTRREQQPYVRAWLWALLCYGFAKGFELGDGVIWQSSGGLLGGHALKHLVAALPGFWLVLALRRAAQQAGRPDAAAQRCAAGGISRSHAGGPARAMTVRASQ